MPRQRQPCSNSPSRLSQVSAPLLRDVRTSAALHRYGKALLVASALGVVGSALAGSYVDARTNLAVASARHENRHLRIRHEALRAHAAALIAQVKLLEAELRASPRVSVAHQPEVPAEPDSESETFGEL